MSDKDMPFGKLSEFWGFVVVVTLFPLCFILLSMMAKPNPFNKSFYTLFSVYLIAQTINRIPIGYRWVNDLPSNLERVFFLIVFSAALYLLLNPFVMSSFLTIVVLGAASVGMFIALQSTLTRDREEYAITSRIVACLALLLCYLPMPVFVFLNRWPLEL
jgi:hypothetical protein